MTRMLILSARLCRFTVLLGSQAGSPARDGSFSPAEVTPKWVVWDAGLAPESRVHVSGSSVLTSGFLGGEGPSLSPPAPSSGLFRLWHERGLWAPGPELLAGSALQGVFPRLWHLLKHNLKGRSAACKGQLQAPQGQRESRRAWG